MIALWLGYELDNVFLYPLTTRCLKSGIILQNNHWRYLSVWTICYLAWLSSPLCNVWMGGKNILRMRNILNTKKSLGGQLHLRYGCKAPAQFIAVEICKALALLSPQWFPCCIVSRILSMSSKYPSESLYKTNRSLSIRILRFLESLELELEHSSCSTQDPEDSFG